MPVPPPGEKTRRRSAGPGGQRLAVKGRPDPFEEPKSKPSGCAGGFDTVTLMEELDLFLLKETVDLLFDVPRL